MVSTFINSHPHIHHVFLTRDGEESGCVRVLVNVQGGEYWPVPFLNGYGKGTKEVLREWMNYAINDPPTWAQSVFPFLLSLYFG